jgi:dTDP-glucose 4,6-dehydratase
MSTLIKVLVTGGCGFIGSKFIQSLLVTGKYFVVNVDKMDYCSSSKNIEICYNLEEGKVEKMNLDNYKFYKLNILETDEVLEILKKENIDILYHFAAQSHVDNSFCGANQFILDNIVGTTSLLEASRRYNSLKKFIHVSTDEVYGDIKPGKEEAVMKYSKLDPTNPYAASKAGAELIVKSYAYSYKLPIIITRSNNVYGPHQYWEKIIPKFIFLLEKNQKVPIYGLGQALRKYLYVDDACEAYLLIMEKGKIGGEYEMGSKNEYSALEMAKILIENIKVSSPFVNWIDFVEDRHFHDSRYLVNSHLLEQLGWKPNTSFQEGLIKTIRWYREYAIPNKHWES